VLVLAFECAKEEKTGENYRAMEVIPQRAGRSKKRKPRTILATLKVHQFFLCYTELKTNAISRHRLAFSKIIHLHMSLSTSFSQISLVQILI
jgi:hypothetical protein